jgi:LPXTG-site transpeptidase (sortase) family protein
MDRRQFLVAAATGSALAATGFASSASAAGPACAYQPVGPTRLLDTRQIFSGPLAPGSIVQVPVHARALLGGGTVPASARAAVLNVTATATIAPGYVSAFPRGAAAIGTSSLNVTGGGQTVGCLSTVRLSADGALELYTLQGCHLVVDLLGYYDERAVARAGRLVPFGPTRMYDTRLGGGQFAAGETRRLGLPSGVAGDAGAVVLNVTTTNGEAPGYWTLWAQGAAPTASNLNTFHPQQTVANQAIVPVTDGGFNVFSLSGGDLILDIAGYFTGPSAAWGTDGLFVPLTPTRLLDTREGAGLNPLVDSYQPRSRKPHDGWTVEVPVAGRAEVPWNAAAVSLALTLTSTEAAGFLTAYPARRDRPLASAVNTSTAGNTVCNHAIVPVSPAGFAVYTRGGAHIVADVNGYFTGQPQPADRPAAPNPPTPGMIFPAVLYVPRLNAQAMTCAPDTSDGSLVRGPGWLVGTMRAGARGNCAIFGHRVSHTEPFRSLEHLQGDDLVELQTITGVARYRVYQVDPVVHPEDPSLYYMASDQPTLTLIACTPPGSTRYRIVARAVMWDFVEY